MVREGHISLLIALDWYTVATRAELRLQPFPVFGQYVEGGLQRHIGKVPVFIMSGHQASVSGSVLGAVRVKKGRQAIVPLR